MKYTILGALLFLLAGCDMFEAPVWEHDYKLRQEMFFRCLKEVPAGPQASHYNDWDEVVSACGSQADWMSKRCVKNCSY
jgi:hypothetical protein